MCAKFTMVIISQILSLCLWIGQVNCMLMQPEQSTRISNLETKVQQLETTLNQVNAQLAKINTQAVAFTAELSATITNLGDHQPIVFDRVITNVGNVYSNLSGHFTAPSDGVYAFYVMATNVHGHSVSLQLFKNGKATEARVLAHGFSGNSGMYVTSTIAILLDIIKGDSVWVQNEYTYSTVEELDGGWSYFSGHLIK